MSDPLGTKDRDYDTDHKIVNDMAGDMFNKMRKNKHKEHCSTVSNFWLLVRLKQEVTELHDAMLNQKSSDDIIAECADIANFAAMIADNHRNKRTN